jgi:hypothetical protein
MANSQEQTYTPPPETQKLIDELYREEVLQARAMDPVEKMMLGGRLFEAALTFVKAGIKHQNPGASEQECERLLTERLRLQQLLENSR